MAKIKVMGLALVAVFVMAAAGASSALALETNNPQFTGEGSAKLETGGNKLLKAGEGEEITATANGSQTLESTGVTIVCSALKLENGKLIGSTAPAAGTNEEVIVYEKCEVKGSPECEINEKPSKEGVIKTVLLKTTLVFTSAEGAKKEEAKHSGTLFVPKEGTKFVGFKLRGKCPATGELGVAGSVVALNEPTPETLSATHEVNAKGEKETKYLTNEGGKTKEAAKPAALKLEGIFSLPATYLGKGIVKAVGSGVKLGIFN